MESILGWGSPIGIGLFIFLTSYSTKFTKKDKDK